MFLIIPNEQQKAIGLSAAAIAVKLPVVAAIVIAPIVALVVPLVAKHSTKLNMNELMKQLFDRGMWRALGVSALGVASSGYASVRELTAEVALPHATGWDMTVARLIALTTLVVLVLKGWVIWRNRNKED